MTYKRTKTAPAQGKSIRSKTVMQAVGDWLFRGNRVYILSEPDRMLTTRKIHWDAETSDVQDDDGQMFYDIPWDDLEFWNPEGYHLPDE
jgi:hypothetical protein